MIDLTGWDRAYAAVPTMMDEVPFEAAQDVLTASRLDAPVLTGEHHDSGHLEPAAPNGSTVYSVIYDDDHAWYTEFGNNNPNYTPTPHVMPAVRAIDLTARMRAKWREKVGG